MKVIHDGRIDSRLWSKRIRCNGCGSTLEVTLLDVIRRDTDRDGPHAVFKCAVCDAECFVAGVPSR